MTRLRRKKGFDFSFNPKACSTCEDSCCSGASGNVWLTQADIASMCSYLETNKIDFHNQYTHQVNNRISLLENRTQDAFECIFFDSKLQQCKIYKARPKQCRDFPFWPHFKGNASAAENECPGVMLD